MNNLEKTGKSLLEMNFTPKMISVEISEKELIDACVELVTKNGCPFAALGYSGFQKIMATILAGLNTKLKINAENIKKHVSKLADDIKVKIKNETCQKLISIKLDIATRCDRSILGIVLCMIYT